MANKITNEWNIETVWINNCGKPEMLRINLLVLKAFVSEIELKQISIQYVD